MTLQLLIRCYLTWGKWKIMPLSSAGSERKLILWFLSQLDTCETYNCKSVPVEEWERNVKGVSRMWQNEGILLLKWKDRIYFINYLTLIDSSTSQIWGWEWILLMLLNKWTAMYIALPPCNVPRYQLDASRGNRVKRGSIVTQSLHKFCTAFSKTVTLFLKMWLYLPEVEKLNLWC